MTTIEFILSVAVVAMVVLQCVILREIHDWRLTILATSSKRRQWVREEHETK